MTARTATRLGVFGGTFDPPHFGHLAAALEAHHLLRLDRMLLVVANDPWQKSGLAPVSPAADRLALTVAAATGIDGLEVSDIEIRRGGPSSTTETLEALRDIPVVQASPENCPDDGCAPGRKSGHGMGGGSGVRTDGGTDRSTDEGAGSAADRDVAPELFMIVGSDAAAGLDTWKRAADIRGLAKTVVVNRTGRQGGRPPSGWAHIVVDVPALDISSADVRARFAEGRPVEALVPQAVIEAVLERGLYGSGR